MIVIEILGGPYDGDFWRAQHPPQELHLPEGQPQHHYTMGTWLGRGGDKEMVYYWQGYL